MMRMIFSTVRAPQEPALTVESLAISATVRPSMVAVPVITPSAGSPSARTLAYRPSSVKLSSSVSSAIRSRANSLPAFAAASWYLGAPPRSMPARTAARSECSRCDSVRMSKLLSRSQRLPAGGPGLTRECGAGFLLRRDAPGHAGAYRPSAGVYPLRPTGGELEQVTRRVDIPIDNQATLIAAMGALGQGQLGFRRTAARAHLGRREEAASHNELAAVPG